MKPIFLLPISLLFSFIAHQSFGQELLEKCGRPVHYVGELDHKEIYVLNTGLSGDLVTFSGKDCERLLNCTSRWKFNQTKWLIHDNELYAVVADDDGTGLFVALYHYSHQFKPTDTLELFRSSTFEKSKTDVFFKQIGEKLVVLGFCEQETKGFSLIKNLSTDTQASLTNFDLNLDKTYVCTDFTIDDSDELFAVFERKEGMETILQRFEYDFNLLGMSYLHIKDGIASSTFVQAKIPNQVMRSFKLCINHKQEVFLGGLAFSSASKNMTGYVLAQFDDESGEFGEFNYSAATDIYNLDLWEKALHQKIAGQQYVPELGLQFLKQIVPLSNGNLIFISQSESIYNAPTSEFVGSPDGLAALPVPPSFTYTTYSPSETFVHGFAGVMTGPLIVSNIHSESASVEWSAKPVHRMFGYEEPQRNSYVKILDEPNNKLTFYYADSKKNLSEKAVSEKKYGLAATQSKNTIAQYEVNLTDGTSEVTPFFTNFNEEPNEILVGSLCKISDPENIQLMTQSLIAITARYRIIPMKN